MLILDTYDDTWIFNTTKLEWKELVMQQVPPARFGHECDISAHDELLMFGGNGATYLSDVWSLNIYPSGTSGSTTSFLRSSTTNAALKPPTATSTILSFSRVTSLPTTTFSTGAVMSTTVSLASKPLSSRTSTLANSVSAISNGTPGSTEQVSVDAPANIQEPSSVSMYDGISWSFVPDQSSSSKNVTVSEIKQAVRHPFFNAIRIGSALLLAVVVLICGLLFLGQKVPGKTTATTVPMMQENELEYADVIENNTATTTAMSTKYNKESSTAMSTSYNGASTYMPSSYGLSIPGYLQMIYGVSVRPKEEIARGGYGKIMLGEIINFQGLPTGMPVIVKEIIVDNSKKSTSDVNAFYQEVSIMAYLGKHINIAVLYGYTEDPHSIVMKYYSIGSLDKWIHKTKTKTSFSQLFSFAFDISRGLEHMFNKGFCHSDLKPQNILIDMDTSTNTAYCVLTDFGITQVFSDKSLLIQAFKTVNINGASVMYSAPEAILKLRKKGHVPAKDLPKFDIYAYAIVLYELLCGKKIIFN